MTRHDLDLFSLLSGLVLTGIALAALFDVGIDIGPWVWPTVLIGIGVVVLGSVLSSGSRTDDGGPDGDPDDGPDGDVLADARVEVDRADRGAPPSDAVARDHAND